MTVEDMLGRMSSRELSEWQAYDQIEPIGWYRVDLAAAIIAALLANQNRKKGAPAFKPSDFMPFLEKPEIDPLDFDAIRSALAPLTR
jgi:hypothetical protein